MLFKVCHDQCPLARHVAIFGVTLCADFGGSFFKPFFRDASSKIKDLITHSNAQLSENAMTYKSVIAASHK